MGYMITSISTISYHHYRDIQSD
uniref:Uncharacterized protein n=1 Tax=Anguilla anguilla TaxID=7936 RepID=A0A0E9T4Y2_ANGAN